jgi:hypothetical protein
VGAAPKTYCIQIVPFELQHLGAENYFIFQNPLQQFKKIIIENLPINYRQLL